MRVIHSMATAGAIAVATIALCAAPRVARAAGSDAPPPPMAPADAGSPPGPMGHGAGGGGWMRCARMRHGWMGRRWMGRGAGTEVIIIRRPGGSWGGRRHGPHAWMMMARVLGLSPAQRESARRIWRREHAGIGKLRGQMRANERRLHSSTPDAPGHAALVGEVSRENGALFSQLVLARENLRANLYALLTPAQKAKLAKVKARFEAARACGAPPGARRR